jgi:hypothetical protein
MLLGIFPEWQRATSSFLPRAYGTKNKTGFPQKQAQNWKQEAGSLQRAWEALLPPI